MSHLYISDLDGTLLRNDASLSEYSRTTLNKLLSEGLQFTVATARSIHSIQTILSGCNITLPVVEFNGAFISDFATREHLVINEIDPSVAGDVFSLMKKYHGDPFLSTYDGNDHLYHGMIGSEGMKQYHDDRISMNDKRLQYEDDLSSKLRHHVMTLTAINTYDVLAPLHEKLQTEFSDLTEIHFWDNQYWPGSWWLTVHDKRATKDKAVAQLASMISHPIEEITVFGDHVQDIPLFNIGKRKVAVANAIDEVKQVATHHIGMNEEDSVMKFIEDEWKSPSPAAA
ncbi:MAG TPA: HAD-IIB family hydrolase [Candidatus Kapabacteria bacterium]